MASQPDPADVYGTDHGLAKTFVITTENNAGTGNAEDLDVVFSLVDQASAVASAAPTEVDSVSTTTSQHAVAELKTAMARDGSWICAIWEQDSSDTAASTRLIPWGAAIATADDGRNQADSVSLPFAFSTMTDATAPGDDSMGTGNFEFQAGLSDGIGPSHCNVQSDVNVMNVLFQQNRNVLNQLVFDYQRGMEPGASTRSYPASVEAVTPATIQEAARKYFNMENRVRVTLMPQQ